MLTSKITKQNRKINFTIAYVPPKVTAYTNGYDEIMLVLRERLNYTKVNSHSIMVMGDCCCKEVQWEVHKRKFSWGSRLLDSNDKFFTLDKNNTRFRNGTIQS